MILVTACFRRETRWIRPQPGLRILHTAMGEAAGEDLERHFARGAKPTAVLSTGFCAGLDPVFETGDVFVAESIRYRGETVHVSASLVEGAARALNGAGLRVRSGPCESASKVLDVADKRRLSEDGVVAADMESGPIAHWAERNGLPFLACRVILDPLGMAIPFSDDRPLGISVLRHPVSTAQLARRSREAGRCLGLAVGRLVGLLEALP